MLDGHVELSGAVGECINLDDVFNNLDLISRDAQVTSDQVFCKPVDERYELGIANDEECISVQSGIVTSAVSAGIVDKKLFLLQVRRSTTLNISDSANGTLPRVETKIEIKCGGAVVYSSGWRLRGWSICTEADCLRSDEIEICMTYRVSGVTFYPATGTGTVRVCGAIVCVGSQSRSVSGYFNPGTIDPECCYGREALYLAAQNADKLCTAYANNGDQSVECYEVNSTGDGNIIIAGALTSNAEFLISGSMQVCYRATSSSAGGDLTIRPVLGCGNETYECFDTSVFVERANQGDPYGRTLCVTIPIDICGNCDIGDSIFAGLSTEVQCNEEPIPGTSAQFVEIISITQEYCVWLFNDFNTDSLPSVGGFKMGRCLTDSAIAPVFDKINQLSAFASNRVPITYQSFSVPSTETQSNDVLIKPAESWPPSSDPTNTGPVPVKKWRINIDVLPCFTNEGTANTEETRIALATAQLTCGGTLALEDSRRWTFTASGGVQLCGSPMRITGCVTCPIDQELRLLMDIDLVVGFFAPLTKFTYEAKAFCF